MGAADVVDRRLRIVLLRDVPLDADLASGGDDCREVQLAIARGRIVRLRLGDEVLHVERAHATPGLADERDRIPTCDGGPIHVDLEFDLRGEALEEDVPGRRSVQRLELPVVVVMPERRPRSATMPTKPLTSSAKRRTASALDRSACS